MTSSASLLPPGLPQLKAPSITQLTGPLEDRTRTADGVISDKQRLQQTCQDTGTRNDVGLNSKASQSASIPATLAAIQRTLVPQKQIDFNTLLDAKSIEELLPPLTSSNEIDLELYAILAIIIKDFVNSWYSKITTDHAFAEEIVQIFAHCSRALEQRFKHVDRIALFFDEVPSLVEQHIKAYRTAEHASIAAPYEVSVRRAYHDMLPCPALTRSSESSGWSTPATHTENYETAYRQLLVQGALAVLLPTEDLQNGPLRTLVADIVADLILGQAIAGKICQPWFLHDAITKAIISLNAKMRPKVDGSELRNDAKSRLETYGLLSSNHESDGSHSLSHGQSQLLPWFWRILQYVYIALSFLRSVWLGFQQTRTHPEAYDRSQPTSNMVGTTSQEPSKLEKYPQQPVLSFRLFSLTSTLLRASDRMPWMSGMIEFWQNFLLYGAGQIARYNSLFDRLIYRTIAQTVLGSSLLPLVLQSLRSALFPDNAMGPPAPPPPSPEQTREMKRGAAEAIASLFPSLAAYQYYATKDDATIVQAIEQDMLAPFDDAYLNKHLIYAMLELILVRLIPEMAEESTTELLAERGVETDELFVIRSDSSDEFSNHSY